MTTEEKAKRRLGFYMYAPALGGAEQYLRELVWGLDRSSFEVLLFAPEWPAFDRFLGLEDSPPLTRVTVSILEPGTRLGRTGASNGADSEPPYHGTHAAPSRMRTLSKLVPFGSRLAPTVQWGLRQAYWGPDRRRIARVLAAHHLDVLHVVNGGYPGSTSARAAVVAARDCNVPERLLTVCSTALPRANIKSVEAAIDRKVAAAATAVIVPATRPLEALVNYRGFARAKIHAIPWGVVDSSVVIDNHEHNKGHARMALGLPAEGPLIGCLANFMPTKGQMTVLQAFQRLHDRMPDVRIAFAGDGPERARVETEAEDLRVGDSVRFLGSVQDAPAFLRALDVFVLASEIEGLPLVILEAMSEGLPVIATDVGGIPDAVSHGTTGFLVPPGRPRELADALALVLTDTRLAHTMGLAARRSFEKRFSLDVMLRQHDTLYRRGPMTHSEETMGG